MFNAASNKSCLKEVTTQFESSAEIYYKKNVLNSSDNKFH